MTITEGSAMESTNGFLPRDGLPHLFQSLATRGYQIIGPRVDQGAIANEHALLCFS